MCIFLQLSVHLTLLLVLLAKVLHWLTSSNPSLLATKTKGSGTWPLLNSLDSTHTRFCPTVYVPTMSEQVRFSAHNKLFLTWPCCFCLMAHTVQHPILPTPDPLCLLLGHILGEVSSTEGFRFIQIRTTDAMLSRV